MSASGRVCEITNGRFVEAKHEKRWLAVRLLRSKPAGRFGSIAGLREQRLTGLTIHETGSPESRCSTQAVSLHRAIENAMTMENGDGKCHEAIFRWLGSLHLGIRIPDTGGVPTLYGNHDPGLQSPFKINAWPVDQYPPTTYRRRRARDGGHGSGNDIAITSTSSNWRTRCGTSLASAKPTRTTNWASPSSTSV